MTNIFIQARMDSERLPNKVLKKICNKTILELILERMKKVNNIKQIILVTGNKEKNRKLVEQAEKLHLNYFCGNENNLLDRFYEANKKFDSDSIIRVTADNPLIDFTLINKGLEIFKKNHFDILSNNRIKTFPYGLNFEIFTKEALKASWNENLQKYENEEKFYSAMIPPTIYMLHEKKFKNFDFTHEEDLSQIRLSVDYTEDFELVKKIFDCLYVENQYFTMNDVLKLLEQNPGLIKINQKFGTTNTT